jgi:hypothetical protein
MDRRDSAVTCDEAELLINLALDDELDARGEVLLSAHLANCPDCRQREMNLGTVNSLVAELGCRRAAGMETAGIAIRDEVVAGAAVEHWPSANASESTASRNAKFRSDRKIGWHMNAARFVPLAVAAIIAMILVVPYFYEPRTADSAEFAADIAEPLVSISQLNDLRQRDQMAACDTMRLELRTLKLEMSVLDDDRRIESVSNRIDQLLARISEIELENTTVLNPVEKRDENGTVN